MEEKRKILVFAPHPDDEILGCGGYLAKEIDNDSLVDIVYLITPEKEIKKEIKKVKEQMGFNNLFFLNQGSGRFLYKSEMLIRKILKILRKTKPDVIIIPHKNESDKDHQFLNDVVIECSFLCESNLFLSNNENSTSVDTILEYEVWTPIQNPNYFVNITKYLGEKRRAMNIYKSQMKYKNLYEMIKGLNRYRGIRENKGSFVEAFQIFKTEIKLVSKNSEK